MVQYLSQFYTKFKHNQLGAVTVFLIRLKNLDNGYPPEYVSTKFRL